MAPFANAGSVIDLRRESKAELRLARRRSCGSGLVFFFDAVADDVGDVLVAFLFFFDEGGIVQALVDLDILILGVDIGGGSSRLRAALLLGLGILERDQFRLRRLRRNLGFNRRDGAR